MALKRDTKERARNEIIFEVYSSVVSANTQTVKMVPDGGLVGWLFEVTSQSGSGGGFRDQRERNTGDLISFLWEARQLWVLIVNRY